MYKGEFKNDLFNGLGCFTSKDFTEFSGKWSKNMKKGNFNIKFLNGDTFEGKYKQNMKNGYGAHIFEDESSYKGMYENDLWNGKGEFINKFGVIHEGYFLEGKLHGSCIVTDTNNAKLFIKYNNNKADGQGQLRMNNKKYEVVYKNGRLISKYEI